MLPTLRMSDLYPASVLTAKNQAPTTATSVSGRVGNTDPTPAFNWLGLVILLVLWRVVSELMPEG